MEVTLEGLGAVQFDSWERQHSLICDQPAENNGHDEGMTPPELLPASLRWCAYCPVDYPKRNKICQTRCESVSQRKRSKRRFAG